jgi:hypothetical protein
MQQLEEPGIAVAETPVDSAQLEIPETEDLGIFDKLSGLVADNIALDDPLVGLVLTASDLVNFALWANEPSMMQTALEVIRTEAIYDKVIRDGFWNRVSAWLDNFDVDSEHTSAPDQRLPIAEIHSPHVDGCTASFATTRSGSFSVSITAFGLGYQRVKNVKVTNSYEVAGQCGMLTTGVDFVIRELVDKSDGRRRALVRLISIDGSLIAEPFKSHVQHPCGVGYENTLDRVAALAHVTGQKMGADFSPLPMRQSPQGSSTHEMELETGVVYSAAIDIPILWSSGSGPLKSISLKIESTVTRSIKMAWKVVSGHDYLRYRGARGDMRMFWAWD